MTRASLIFSLWARECQTHVTQDLGLIEAVHKVPKVCLLSVLQFMGSHASLLTTFGSP